MPITKMLRLDPEAEGTGKTLTVVGDVVQVEVRDFGTADARFRVSWIDGTNWPTTASTALYNTLTENLGDAVEEGDGGWLDSPLLRNALLYAEELTAYHLIHDILRNA